MGIRNQFDISNPGNKGRDVKLEASNAMRINNVELVGEEVFEDRGGYPVAEYAEDRAVALNCHPVNILCTRQHRIRARSMRVEDVSRVDLDIKTLFAE